MVGIEDDLFLVSVLEGLAAFYRRGCRRCEDGSCPGEAGKVTTEDLLQKLASAVCLSILK